MKFQPPPMPAFAPFPGSRLPIVRRTIQQLFTFAFDAGTVVGFQTGLTLGIAIGAVGVGLIATVVITRLHWHTIQLTLLLLAQAQAQRTRP